MALIRPKNIPTANLSDGTNFLQSLTDSDMPAGTVVQIAYNRYDPNADTYTAISADTEANSPVTLTVTPKFADSKLWIIGRMHVRMQNAMGCTFGMKRDNVKLEGMSNRGGSNDFFYKGETLNHHYTATIVNFIDSGSTSPTTFQPWGQGWTGSWELSYGHGEHSITVYEIKQ